MSWFDEQLRYRQSVDDAGFAEAIDSIAGAVMGKRLRDSMSSDEITGSAVDEVLKYYGYKAKKDEDLPHFNTVDELIEHKVRPFGIMSRNVTLDKGWYRHAVGAMLGTLTADGSPVVLIPGKISGYSFYNVKDGTRTRLNRKTEKLVDREALCFYQPLPLKSLHMGDLMKFTFSQLNVSDIVLSLLLMAGATALGLLTPLFTKWLFGDVLESGSVQVLIALAWFMVCFSLSQLCFTAFQSLINSRITIKQDVAVQAAVMSRLMSLPTSFFKQFSAGELTQRATYVQSLCTLLFSTIATTGLTSLFSLIYIGQIFAFAPSLVVPSLIVVLATLVTSLVTSYTQMKVSREQMKLSAKTSGLTYATITGIQKIKLAGAEKRMFARWAKRYSAEAELTYNPPLFLKLSTTISLTISLLGSLALYAAAIKSSVSVADYYAFNAAYGMVSSAFMSLSGIAASVAMIKPILEMAKPIMETAPEMQGEKEIITDLAGSILLDHVSFRYNDEMPYVINDLTLKIKSGEYLAIVGSTGCGKSTLMRLLLGFETPQKGNIYYGRKDISKVDLQSLRKKIGVVTQDGKLFLGDIYSNIIISAPHLSQKEAWNAAEIASIAEDIRNMPMGMHTIIGEGLGGISGGQRQRLMIARAVAPSPKILMFDEATSALDNVTQRNVSNAIDALNCTRIVIAHRLSTIMHADRIIYLENGRIAEEGTYEELIAKNGLFASLVERQRLDVD